MRKNYFHPKNLDGVYSVYEIEGLNQDRLIKNLKNGGLTLYNVKKIANHKMSLEISVKQDKNFFAIVEKMCYTNLELKPKIDKKRKKLLKKGVIASKSECGYNIKRTRVHGKAYPLYYLFTHVGVLIGAIIFCLGAYHVDDYIFSFEFTGSGNVVENRVVEYLNSVGVEKGKRFSEFDLNVLADGILAENPLLSYAGCLKRGNKMVIELVLAKNGTDILDESIKSLSSDVDGVVKELKVYRGTPLVGVGDRVSAGDLLVDGVISHKDVQIETNVLAKVVVLAEFNYTFISQFDDRETHAELLAIESLNLPVEYSKITKQPDKDGYLYTVTLYYNRVFVAG